MLWQLKKLSTNEALTSPAPLPENWGPIFGMAGIQDQLADLSWLGEAYSDQGWVQVEGEATPDVVGDPAEIAWEQAKKLLRESDWTVLPDVPMTTATRDSWIAYRAALRDIRLQADFPDAIIWPTKPE